MNLSPREVWWWRGACEGPFPPRLPDHTCEKERVKKQTDNMFNLQLHHWSESAPAAQ